MDMFVTQTLNLTNYGNAPAQFNWNVPGQLFAPKPLSGEVDAGSTQKIEITFNPNGPRAEEEKLFLKITDGET